MSSNETREKLITVGLRLFAEQGVFRVPLRSVIDQAEQKNTSALHYHFGGREGLLQAIIDRHNDSIEAERSMLLARIEGEGRTGDVRSVVEAVVLPFARKLDSEQGREFLRVVAQLSELFDFWEAPGSATPPQAQLAFKMLAKVLGEHSGEIRHERVTTFLMLVSESLALRARQIDRGKPLGTSQTDFLNNLIDMSVGALQAPSGGARTTTD